MCCCRMQGCRSVGGVVAGSLKKRHTALTTVDLSRFWPGGAKQGLTCETSRLQRRWDSPQRLVSLHNLALLRGSRRQRVIQRCLKVIAPRTIKRFRESDTSRCAQATECLCESCSRSDQTTGNTSGKACKTIIAHDSSYATVKSTSSSPQMIPLSQRGMRKMTRTMNVTQRILSFFFGKFHMIWFRDNSKAKSRRLGVAQT